MKIIIISGADIDSDVETDNSLRKKRQSDLDQDYFQE